MDANTDVSTVRAIRAGLACALLGVVLAAAALYVYPGLTGPSSGQAWALGALAAAVVLVAICGVQLTAWTRARRPEPGGEDDLAALRRTSWIAHLVSYAVVVFALWAGISASLAAGPSATAAGLLGVSLLFTVLGQVLAGVQYLRDGGPPGTIPAHLRRLMTEINRRR